MLRITRTISGDPDGSENMSSLARAFHTYINYGHSRNILPSDLHSMQVVLHNCKNLPGPKFIKLFMLNSTKHEILNAHKN